MLVDNKNKTNEAQTKAKLYPS